MRGELFILSLTIYEAFLNCSPKNVHFFNFEKAPRRSIAVVVEAPADKCPGLHELYYKWELSEVNGPVMQTATKPYITINGYSFSSDVVFTNDYKLTVSVSHHPDMNPSSSFTDVFRFAPDKMHIEIKGGTEKTHPCDTLLEVDAKSMSRDRSYPPSEDAFKSNIIQWAIEPEIQGYTPTSDLILRVPDSLLKVNQVHKFTVNVTRKKFDVTPSIGTASQTVTVTSPDVPELNIECIRNCLQSHPKEKTALRVVCTKNCANDKKMNYKWTVHPSIGSDKMDFGDGFDKLVIESGAFKEGDHITVKVKSALATSSYSLEFMRKMKKGTCQITPKEGVSGITVFKVQCKGFSSPNGNLIYLIYQKSNKVKTDLMLNEDKSLKENNVFLSEGSPAVIRVKVQDEAYMEEEVQLTVDVKPFSPKQNTSKVDTIKTLVLGEGSESVVSLSLEQYRNKITQMISYILDAIDNTSEMTEKVKMDLHKHMAQCLLEISPHDFTTSCQITYCLTKLQAFKLATDTHTSRLIGKSIQSAAKVVHSMVYMHSIKEDAYIPAILQTKFVEDISYLSSKLMEQVAPLETVLEKEIIVHDYDSYDEMMSSKLRIRDNLRDLTDSVLTSIQILGTTMLRKAIPDERPTAIKNDLINFFTRRVLLSTLLVNQTITYPDATESKVFLPKSLIGELREKHSFIDYQFAVMNKNPFWWHQSNTKLNTEIVLFDFFDGCRKIKTTKNPFYVHLKAKNIPTGVLKGNLTEAGVAAHRVRVEAGSVLVVVFKASTGSYKVTSSECYCKKEDFDWGIEIRSDSKEGERTLEARPSGGKNVVYVCVMKLGTPLQYEGHFAVFSCKYWNLRIGQWSSDGCKIQKASLQNGSSIVCECMHASFFTGQIFVPPNKINFSLELDFHIELLKNWLALLFVLCSILFWNLVLVGAWFMDRKHFKRNVVHRLDDDVPGDSHAYLIVVVTGFFLDAGTTADVAIQLLGEKANSRVHLIKCAGITLLQRNTQDWFIIHTPCYLGDVKKIRLWHNCKGIKPHWYCQRIIIQHLKTGVQYFFIVEKWFSLIWGSGRIYHEINSRNKIFLKSNKLLFLLNLEYQVKEGHLWLSVFTRDAQSNFSSMERIGSSVCTFFLSMLASAMFHGIPRNAPTDSMDPNSSFFLTYHDLAIIIESWIVSVPIGILVVQIFRNSAPYASQKSSLPILRE